MLYSPAWTDVLFSRVAIGLSMGQQCTVPCLIAKHIHPEGSHGMYRCGACQVTTLMDAYLQD